MPSKFDDINKLISKYKLENEAEAQLQKALAKERIKERERLEKEFESIIRQTARPTIRSILKNFSQKDFLSRDLKPEEFFYDYQLQHLISLLKQYPDSYFDPITFLKGGVSSGVAFAGYRIESYINGWSYIDIWLVGDSFKGHMSIIFVITNPQFIYLPTFVYKTLTASDIENKFLEALKTMLSKDDQPNPVFEPYFKRRYRQYDD